MVRNMIIFFRSIPKETLNSEITSFIQPALKGGILKPKGKITKNQIVVLKDTARDLIEVHALVNIEPESAAVNVIKKMNGQRFKGKPITVRKYYVRNPGNDKRSNHIQASRQILEKRVNPDRRRKLEKLDTNWMEHLSYNTLYRQLNS